MASLGKLSLSHNKKAFPYNQSEPPGFCFMVIASGPVTGYQMTSTVSETNILPTVVGSFL